MRSVSTTLLAAVSALLPLLSLQGHVDLELAASLDEREIVVTGHIERDATLHIEAASGVVHQRCPECVLDKRRFGTDRQAKPVAMPGPSGPKVVPRDATAPSAVRSATAPARAPPLV